MKNVLLLIHDDDGQEARFQAALDLTRTLSGHLTCLDIVRLPEFIAEYVSTAGGTMLEVDERDRAAQNRLKLEPRLEHENVTWDWENKTGDVADIICQRVDLSDIIVLNTNLHDRSIPDMREITSAVAVKSHKAILAVPDTQIGFAAHGHAMVAWDGSAPAVAALRAATPILAFSSKVTIVEIDHRKNCGVPAADAAEYLSRHRIHAEIQSRSTDGLVTVASVLLSAVEDGRADYMVLGAYGHSRMTEAVFGGVTRTMMVKSRIPLILAH